MTSGPFFVGQKFLGCFVIVFIFIHKYSKTLLALSDIKSNLGAHWFFFLSLILWDFYTNVENVLREK